LLGDMGVLDSFLAEGHDPCFGNRSVWGNSGLKETDLLRDPDGHGWHLDRRRFDNSLRDRCKERGAGLLASVKIESVERSLRGEGWVVSLASKENQTARIEARILVDSTGRIASLSRRLGAIQHSTEPPMVSIWATGNALEETAMTAGFTCIEAVEDGWWYTAPLPNSWRVLAFHTDQDLALGGIIRSPEQLLRQAACAPLLSSVLRECKFQLEGTHVHRTLAHGGKTSPACGSGWFAAGDAAIHFDPLSSQGLLNALFTGLASAEAANRVLAGEDAAEVAAGYQTLIDGIGNAYLSHRDWWYCQENRWPNEPFWARRHSIVLAHTRSVRTRTEPNSHSQCPRV
jgi:flavin-dependent dehydrogenase